MNRILNIALNIETLSRKTNAAIIAITAVPFERRLDCVNDTWDLGSIIDQSEMFHRVINGTSCVMEGLDVEPDTVQWWKNHTDLDKSEILEKAVSLQSALHDFAFWVNRLRNEADRYKAETMEVWILGPTFDWPILMNAFQAAGVPFQYPHQCNVRDIRTYCENAVMILKGEDKAYADRWRDNLDEFDENDICNMNKTVRLARMVQAADKMMAKAALVTKKADEGLVGAVLPSGYHNGGLIPSPSPSPVLGPGYNPVMEEPVILGDPNTRHVISELAEDLNKKADESMPRKVKAGTVAVIMDRNHKTPVIAAVSEDINIVPGCVISFDMPVFVCNHGWLSDNNVDRDFMTNHILSCTFMVHNSDVRGFLVNTDNIIWLSELDLHGVPFKIPMMKDRKHKEGDPYKFIQMRQDGFGWHSIVRYYEENDRDPDRYYTLMIDRFKDNGVLQYHAVIRHNSDGSITPMNTLDPVMLNLTVRDCRNGDVYGVRWPEAVWMLKLFRENYEDITVAPVSVP